MKVKHYLFEESKREVDAVIAEAKKNKSILAVALFGSALKGKGRDIDLCLFLDKKKSNLEMSKLKREIAGKVSQIIDVQIFQQLPLYIRARIIKEGRIIFVKDLDKLYALYFEVIREYGL